MSVEPREDQTSAERIAAKDTLAKFAQVGQLAGGAAGAAMGLNHFAPYLASAAPGVVGPALGGAAASFAAGRLASSVLRSPTLANRLIDRSLCTARPGVVNRLLGDAASAAPETAAPIYNRGGAVEPTANDNTRASLLDNFLRTRPPQRAGMLP